MSAYVYIFERNKELGYYQNDMKCECVFEFAGWAALDFVMNNTHCNFEVEGTAVLSSSEDMGRVLTTREEYYDCCKEDIEYEKNNPFCFGKYSYHFRVEKRLFDTLISSEEYREWCEDVESKEDRKWVKEQIAKLKEALPKFDFEKNYYYIIDSY